MEQWVEDRLDNIVNVLSPCRECPFANTERYVNLPGQKAVIETLDSLVSILFPGCHGFGPLDDSESDKTAVRLKIGRTFQTLADQCTKSFAYHCEKTDCTNCGECKLRGRNAAARLLDALPTLRATLENDITAAYEGDPAARSNMEVVMSYPGLYAITVHRIAHELYEAGVPLIPRVMSERAHTRTGIDIHPGAKIGSGFFIDHGTGVVIGETCTIGSHVKLYQGVTLGALSFAKDSDGKLVKGIKRHPDVEDNVIIYAGATILGGKTVIGHNSVIGGGVWLIHSVPAWSKVYNQEPEPVVVNHAPANGQPHP